VPGFDDIESSDSPMMPQEQAVADSLSPDMVAKIDAGLLSLARKTQRKVAMLVGLAMMDPSLRVPGLPDVFYAQRIKALVDRGLLVATGNLDRMRYSEVRVP
jgi:hypothetical protein